MRTETDPRGKLPSMPAGPKGELAAVHSVIDRRPCNFATRVLSACTESLVGHLHVWRSGYRGHAPPPEPVSRGTDRERDAIPPAPTVNPTEAPGQERRPNPRSSWAFLSSAPWWLCGKSVGGGYGSGRSRADVVATVPTRGELGWTGRTRPSPPRPIELRPDYRSHGGPLHRPRCQAVREGSHLVRQPSDH